jgi:hypothetical protein
MEARRNKAVGQVVHKQLKAVDADKAARRSAEHRARLAYLRSALKVQRREMLVGEVLGAIRVLVGEVHGWGWVGGWVGDCSGSCCDASFWVTP